MAMQEIQGHARSVSELLREKKYAIDYYQRDYKWEQKQIAELIEDLTTAFLEDHQPDHSPERVADYGRYFLGYIIVSRKDGRSYIVDGQQRLTSLTLLLLYLRDLLKGKDYMVSVDTMIFSVIRQKPSFNLDIDERIPAMQALFEGKEYSGPVQSDSVQNILDRYQDIVALFPEELTGDALPFFVDWLSENVHLVEITTYSDEDAYTVFETMNDRGLSLSPTDMLKGFLLAKITDSQLRTQAANRWKERTTALRDIAREVESDFFKAWLRSQYAMTVRGTAKNETPKDFDRIGTEFHRWVRDHADAKHDDPLVLNGYEDYFRLIDRDITFYSRIYERLMRASTQPVPGWEAVMYNAKQGFTLQFMPLLAPLTPDDSDEAVAMKVRLVATYLDIWLTRRTWNYRRNTYNQMYRPMFQLTRDIRGMGAETLAMHLHGMLQADIAQADGGLKFNWWFGMHGQNGWYVHLLLARLTQFVEVRSGLPDRYMEYINAEGNQRFEIEHIWSNHYEQHIDEYPDSGTWHSDRNKIGGLLLVPKKFNAAYGDKPYKVKYEQYNSQNLLARSLTEQAYTLNPGFKQFRGATQLPFAPHREFKQADLRARCELYRAIADKIWDPVQLLREVGLE